MDKPAYVLLLFDKSNLESDVWLKIIANADTKHINEHGTIVLVNLLVKSYSMEDHQFIQLRMGFPSIKEKEVKVWIPRNYVKAIFEGKADLTSAFSFAGKATMKPREESH